MKKTRTIALIASFIVVVILLFIVLLSTRAKKEEFELVHYDVPTFTWDTPVSTSNGEMDLAEISASLAPLTSEDGTGEINLNMTVDEIATVLDENGIPYEIRGEWGEFDGLDYRRIFAANGNTYEPYAGDFSVAQTKSGLKISDPFSRAVEIYGEPDLERIDSLYDNVHDHYYNMGKLYSRLEGCDKTVVMQLFFADDTLMGIYIRFIYDWEEEEDWFE